MYFWIKSSNNPKHLKDAFLSLEFLKVFFDNESLPICLLFVNTKKSTMYLFSKQYAFLPKISHPSLWSSKYCILILTSFKILIFTQLWERYTLHSIFSLVKNCKGKIYVFLKESVLEPKSKFKNPPQVIVSLITLCLDKRKIVSQMEPGTNKWI